MLRTWDTLGIVPRVSHSSYALKGIHRNYVTQYILRRVLTDFYGLDVHYVMNITNIDDKVAFFLSYPAFSNECVLDNQKSQGGPSSSILYPGTYTSDRVSIARG